MKNRIAIALLALAAAVPAQDSVAVRRGTVRETLDRSGTFVPAGPSELKLALKGYRGELRLVEVRPHGSVVNKGDVVARLETEDLDDQIVRETRALERLRMDLRHLQEKTRMEAEKDALVLARAERDLLRAQTRLRGYREHEKAYREESERLAIQRAEHRMDDQKDELTQLEKMYGEDELVDATEEIVLKRERRGYARSQAQHDLNEANRIYRKEFYEAWVEEDHVSAVEDKAASLDRTKRSQALEREKEAADLAQKQFDVARQEKKLAELKEDLAQLVVRAPGAGLLLHEGKPLEVDATLKNRVVFAKVADPKRVEVSTDVPEKDVLGVRDGAAVELVPEAAEDRTLMGRLELDYLPAKAGLFGAKVSVSDVPVGVRPGMTCKVRIIRGEERDAVVVPKAAVVEKEEGAFVRCSKSEQGPFEPRPVTVGLSDGENVAIRDGLAEGEFVLVEKK